MRKFLLILLLLGTLIIYPVNTAITQEKSITDEIAAFFRMGGEEMYVPYFFAIILQIVINCICIIKRDADNFARWIFPLAGGILATYMWLSGDSNWTRYIIFVVIILVCCGAFGFWHYYHNKGMFGWKSRVLPFLTVAGCMLAVTFLTTYSDMNSGSGIAPPLDFSALFYLIFYMAVLPACIINTVIYPSALSKVMMCINGILLAAGSIVVTFEDYEQHEPYIFWGIYAVIVILITFLPLHITETE